MSALSLRLPNSLHERARDLIETPMNPTDIQMSGFETDRRMHAVICVLVGSIRATTNSHE